MVKSCYLCGDPSFLCRSFAIPENSLNLAHRRKRRASCCIEAGMVFVVRRALGMPATARRPRLMIQQVAPLLTELRVSGTAGEEVLERLPQRDDGHLRGVLGDLPHPRELCALYGVQLAAQGPLGGLGRTLVLLPSRVLVLPFGPRPVVGEAHGARRAGKIGRLHVIGIERDLGGDQHHDTFSCEGPPRTRIGDGRPPWVRRPACPMPPSGAGS